MPERDSAPDYRRRSTLTSLDDETWVLRFDGPYEDLWVTREVTIDKAADREAERAGQRYGVGTSTLVDAGQWYAVEAMAAASAQDGVDRLAAGTADEDTYWTVLDALATTAAATEEIEKFIPPDAEDVPVEACWTEFGRRVRDHRRDALRRPRLRGERAFYLRQFDKVQASYGPGTEMAVDGQPAEPDSPGTPTASAPDEAPVLAPGPRDEAADPAAPLPARTLAEAHLFMDVSPCGCGSAGFPRLPFDILASDAESYVLRFAGPCDDCERLRDFRFRLPQRPGTSPESPHRFSFAGDGPSAILDPGDWVAAANVYGAVADALRSAVDDASAEFTDDDRAALLRLLSTSAYALDEALRFLPADADAVPATAFWTDTGREVRQAAPERFDRFTLTEWRTDRWRRLDDFVTRYGEATTAPSVTPPQAPGD